MAGIKGNSVAIDAESVKSAVDAIREQLVLGLEALAELERVRDHLDMLATHGTVSRNIVDNVINIRLVACDDLSNEVKGFTNALVWVRTLELAAEEGAR